METDTQTTGTDAPADQTQAADTVDTQASEASTQVDDTPEVTQGEGEQSQEVNTEDTVEEKLFAGKYKSIEELESAYKSAESKLGTVNSRNADLTKLLNDAFTAPEPTGEDTDSFEDTSEASSGDDSIKRDMSVMKFVMGHPDASGAAMAEVLANDPFIGNINSYEAKLEYAYAKSQSMTTKEAVAQAEKRTAQQTQTKIVEKQAAQVEGASRTEKLDEKDELRKKFTTGSPDERKQARIDYFRKYMV